MSKTKNSQSADSIADQEAMAMARGTQKPGQTKEQTKLIAQGIKKGIELYKKQQSAKQRELDKKRKKLEKEKLPQPASEPTSKVVYKQHWLPWTLLLISWIGMALYLSLMAA